MARAGTVPCKECTAAANAAAAGRAHRHASTTTPGCRRRRSRVTDRTAGRTDKLPHAAFLDGIALHQNAQWHNMGSAVLRPDTMAAMSRNMVWDGAFHLFAWALTLLGVFALWRDGRSAPTLRTLVGQMFTGWGAFNLIEGLIDHHLLGIHHVRDMPFHVPAYDWLFLGIGGLGVMLLGLILAQSAAPRADMQGAAHSRGRGMRA